MPSLISVNSQEIKNIGIASYVSPHPQITYIGTTVFNNSESVLDLDWRLNERITETVEACLVTEGLNPVIIDTKEFDEEATSEMISYEDGRWFFSNQNKVKALKEAYDIDAVVIVDQFKSCVIQPCEINQAEGYGLFVRSAFGFKAFYATHHFSPVTYYLNQPGWHGNLVGFIQGASPFSTQLEDFEEPEDYNNISEDEMSKVEIAVENYIDFMGKAVCSSIMPKVGS